MLKAIETSYKGYRMRSRLEARWAVFLDSLGIRWSYEHEGFDLAGTWYLPDFWIEDWSAWLEIKPRQPNRDEQDKCQLLASLQTTRVLMVCGDPWPGEYVIWEFGPWEPVIESFIPAMVWDRFGACRRCPGLLLVQDDIAVDALGNHTERCLDRWPWPDDKRLTTAFTAARQARWGR
jgi:hypothetical protein